MNSLHGEAGYSDEEDGRGRRLLDKLELFPLIFDPLYVSA